jgi:hypothetical protein
MPQMYGKIINVIFLSIKIANLNKNMEIMINQQMWLINFF